MGEGSNSKDGLRPLQNLKFSLETLLEFAVKSKMLINFWTCLGLALVVCLPLAQAIEGGNSHTGEQVEPDMGGGGDDMMDDSNLGNDSNDLGGNDYGDMSMENGGGAAEEDDDLGSDGDEGIDFDPDLQSERVVAEPDA